MPLIFLGYAGWGEQHHSHVVDTLLINGMLKSQEKNNNSKTEDYSFKRIVFLFKLT